MEFRQIQYFLSLYEEGSMTKAASRLNVVQPALSIQLAKLEKEIGQKLFTRNTRGLEPTPAGRQMYTLFRPVMSDFSRARDWISQTQGELTGHLSIGLIASVAEGLLAPALGAFCAAHPRISLSLSDGYTPALCKAVTEGTLDAAIINKPRRRLALTIHPLLSESFVLAVGKKHPPLPKQVPLRRAIELKLVLPTRLHGLRDILDSFAEAEGMDLAPAIEVDSIQAIMQLVEHGDYATLLPGIAVRRGVKSGALIAHKITDPSLTWQVVCVTHPRRQIGPAVSAFIEVLKQQAGK
ncbi:MAG: LysR family transcriptional regulator [Candidatus Protistobacter heckmanni]|nr:LysR family transcriptional regulator [Candidatus Protistobacter heckmanni]